MRRSMMTLAFLALLLVGATPSSSQPAARPAPRATAPAPAPAMTVAPAAMTVPVPAMAAMAPKVAPVAPAAAAPSAGAPVMAPASTSAPVAAMGAPMATEAPVMAPAPVSAQPAAMAAQDKPKVSGWDKADKWIGLIVKILIGLLSIIGAILGVVKGQDWRAKLKTERWQKILGYVDQAFPVVESLAKGTSWKGDDKLVELLKRVNDWLKGEGAQGLSAEEMALVKREAADKAAKLKTDNGAADKVDAKAVTRNG